MSNFVTLLVEDDPLQPEIMSDLLRDEGFEVVDCATAEGAEFIVTSTAPESRALVTDRNLACNMTGADSAQYAQGRHPRLNIIVMSGTVVNRLPPRSVFLQEPLLPRQLLDAVRDRRAAPAHLALRRIRQPLEDGKLAIKRARCSITVAGRNGDH